MERVVLLKGRSLRVDGSFADKLVIDNSKPYLLAQYRENAAFSQFAADLDPSTKQVLERGVRLTQILKQDQFKPTPIASQVILLYAGSKGYIDKLNELDLNTFINTVVVDLESFNWLFVEEINTHKDFSDDTEQLIKDYVLNQVEFVLSS